jgi:hypothetical protein
MIGTHGTVRIWWSATAAKVRISIKADDWNRYSDFAKHSLHSRIAHNWTDWSEGDRTLLFVLGFHTCFHRQRFHAAQRRRDVELHYRHHTKILGAHNGLWIARLAGGSARLRKQNERDRPEAKQNGEQEAEFEEC